MGKLKSCSIIFVVLLLFLVSCTKEYTQSIVLIQTRLGDIKVRLYNETPIHRDNFLKLVKDGTIDSTLFHRVIKDFMIQGGDPDSKYADTGQVLGEGGPGYTLPAEINFPKYFHKRGALAAAREGDKVNPKKRSSGSQFYIVQGEILSDNDLIKIENKIRESNKRSIFNNVLMVYNDSLNELQRSGDESSMVNMQQRIMAEVNQKYSQVPEFSFPDSIKDIYMSIGGTPHLDGNYTVFGEVIEDKTLWEKFRSLLGKKYGMEVVDAIANELTDGRNRPLKDIRMHVKILKE